MPLHAQTMSNNLEDTDVSRVDASEPREARAAGYIAAQDVESSPETIAIELNFNAFADNVPPTQHARRVASNSDPSVQDFADQALELAALRAELKRLTRDYDAVRHTLRLRDMRLQAMQDELSSARTQLRNMTRQLTEARSRPAAMIGESVQEDSRPAEPVKTSPVRETPLTIEPPVAHELSSTLLLPVLQAEAPAVVPETTSATRETHVLPLTPRRQLIPLNHDGEAVLLSRDIITIGRTRGNDICIASRAVSRDHARLLMSPRSVTIVDMNSANGCFVNDQPVKKQKLRDGDVLRIGDRSYRFANDADPAQQGRDL
jgi:pSer/pThr/pTyr-binding forkhead associated (FHA) protein